MLILGRLDGQQSIFQSSHPLTLLTTMMRASGVGPLLGFTPGEGGDGGQFAANANTRSDQHDVI